MTCIACIKYKGKLYIAADRRISWETSQIQECPSPKVVKRDGVIIAGAGDAYLLTLLTSCLSIPNNETDIDTYMHHHFQKAVKKLLIGQGFVDPHGLLRVPPDMELECVLAVQGILWSIAIVNAEDVPNGLSLVLIDKVNTPYATGSGGQLAWGSLLTTETMNMKPKERLQLALNVASRVDPGCDNKVDIEHE